ncbi:MAG: GNAT family N-acetyltransferase [Anaerolineaceae bacterium]|nr:GNAT family N-acetyltransferase [Anaerolineaceae bacterium]
MALIIRRATLPDAAIIAEYNVAMALETENIKLDPGTVNAGVNALLASPASEFYIVAEVDGNIAACLLITTEWSDWRNGVFWWIQSVYVAPSHRRKGLYRTMYSRIKEMANKEENVCGFRLYVDKENLAAQKTYRSLGMEPMHYILFHEENK